MSGDTSIGWTDRTWNPVTGCTHVSAGCDRCYAAAMTHRLDCMGREPYRGLTVLQKPAAVARGVSRRHFNGVVRCHEDQLDVPLGWRKPKRIFVNSMSDLFHEAVPFDFIGRVFATMIRCGPNDAPTIDRNGEEYPGKPWPGHVFQILTKRPRRMAEFMRDWEAHTEPYLADGWELMPDEWHRALGRKLPHVWLGVSAEDAATFKHRVRAMPWPAGVAGTFASIEPLLGPLDALALELVADVDWIIVGGESGPGARPMDPDWVRAIRDRARSIGVPFYVKQMGSAWMIRKQRIVGARGRAGKLRGFVGAKGERLEDLPEDLRVREFPR